MEFKKQTSHIPVLLKEVIEYLDPQAGQNFIDATVGDGGHAKAILEKIGSKGRLIAIDRDSDSFARAQNNLKSYLAQVLFINDSFGNLNAIVEASRIKPIQGILFDFGMSSSQLEASHRGFSFQKDEPLDMRFDKRQDLTAALVVNGYSKEKLAEIFYEYGEERKARIIAGAVAQARRKKRIVSTKDLAEIIGSVKAREGKIHPATKVFQALRIEVNQEFSEIEKVLAGITNILTLGARAVFISFHSGEDRLVKKWAKNQKNTFKILTKKPAIPNSEEIKINPRSRSAKLRAVERI